MRALGRLAPVTRLPRASRAGRSFVETSAPALPLSAERRRFCASFTVNFVSADGNTNLAVKAKSGQTILECAHEHNIDIEGACGGECACSTCHVILEQEAFDKLEEQDDDEADMLDLAAHVSDTSRLGCQVKLLKERDEGMKIMLPPGSVNLG
mmetsp:Transcript_68185/g.200230  ORF Transcript_68185/g.200230 Transcript_68185/m.200230 type:complete len:153 (-) Transcript_68185:49-507(-)